MIEETPREASIVLAHGMSQDHRYFTEHVKRLKDRFKLLLVDLPGHGLASGVDGPFGHVEIARHVASELRKNGISNACYWGTHTGATVAPLVLNTCSDTITSLVLEGPGIAGQNPPVVVEKTERAKEIARDQGVVEALDSWWTDTPWFKAIRDQPDAFRASEHLTMVKDFGGAPWLDQTPTAKVQGILALLKEIKVPTLIYTGEFDHPDFQQSANQMAALITNAGRLNVEGTGGFPAWEKPAQVVQVVERFIQSTKLER